MDAEAITFRDVDPAVLADLPDQPSAFMELLGFTPTLVSPSRIEGHVEADARLHQAYGIVHGGVHAAIVETVCSIGAAAAVHADGRGVVGISNTTDFVRAHRTGRLDVVADAVHVGRTQHLWRASLTRADGKLVAQGQVRLQVVDPRGLGK